MNSFCPHSGLRRVGPAVTFTLPPHLTATTGMDAFDARGRGIHWPLYQQETRALALRATQRIFASLEAAFQDGQNCAACADMLAAAYEAGIAFSKSYVGCIHAAGTFALWAV